MNRWIDTHMWSGQRLKNSWHTLVLFTGMLLLSGLMGWLFAGTVGMVGVLMATLISVLVAPRLSMPVMLRWLGARPLAPMEAPSLYANLKELTRRAGLNRMPTLVYLRTHKPRAFTTGSRDDAVIAVTEGLLQALNMRELTAVMAHEISHLKNNDLWMMNVSATFNRMTSMLATVGQILLLLNLPLMLLSGQHISWIAILVLMLAPAVAMLMQLALSRTREFAADLGAAALTQDPQGLAAALLKIEHHQHGWLGRLGWLRRPNPYEAIWHTHPATRERINRLMAVAPKKPMMRLRPCRNDATGSGLCRGQMGILNLAS